jgi:hypothetical protein
MLAADFFHVDCAVSLQRRHCLFVMEVGSRYAHILGVTANPDGPWTVQQIRNLLTDLDDRAADLRFLVRDRAGLFTSSFQAGPGRRRYRGREDPAAQPASECFCGTLRAHRPGRAEVTDRMLIFGERHLHLVLAQYAAHYTGRRPPSQLPASPAPARPPWRGPLPGTDPAPAHPRRPRQRVRAGRIESQVSTSGRVLESHRRDAEAPERFSPVGGIGVQSPVPNPVDIHQPAYRRSRPILVRRGRQAADQFLAEGSERAGLRRLAVGSAHEQVENVSQRAEPRGEFVAAAGRLDRAGSGGQAPRIEEALPGQHLPGHVQVIKRPAQPRRGARLETATSSTVARQSAAAAPAPRVR